MENNVHQTTYINTSENRADLLIKPRGAGTKHKKFYHMLLHHIYPEQWVYVWVIVPCGFGGFGGLDGWITANFVPEPSMDPIW